MFKKTLLALAAAIAAQGAFAAVLTPEEALQRASSENGARRIAGNGTAQLAYTVADAEGQPAVYVFNRPSGEGILFVGADDIAMPILGYTDEGSFDPNNIPRDVAYWLGEYASQISYGKASGMKRAKAQTYPTSWTYIAPMVKTRWDQGAPYNNGTPMVGNAHTPTGCVATAMAQVMKYWEYPEVGQGSKTYTNNGNRLSLTFDRTPFDWSNMLDTYTPGHYNETQAEAVAYLMKACGYGAEMNYAMGGSGTQTGLAGAAMVNYFKYDNGIQYAERFSHTDSEWSEMVYNQLKNVGPVIYDGSSVEGGHAFVIDGYDGNGYFHVNWGWGGLCNGYYLLTALTPSQQGTGGSYGGYNSGQGMLFNIKKATSEDQNTSLKGELSMYGSLSATNAANKLTFTISGWNPSSISNLSLATVNAVFGIEIQKADGSGNPSYVQVTTPSGVTNLAPGYYYPTSRLNIVANFTTSLPDGKYKVSFVYKSGTQTNNWVHFHHPVGTYDYVYVTKSGSDYTVENIPMENFTISDLEITTPLYFNSPCMVKFNITNNSDLELTQSVMPTLSIDGKINYQCDNQLIVVQPHETLSTSVVYTFQRVDGGKTPSTASPVEFELGAMNYETKESYGSFGKVTMKRSASNLKVELLDLAITNAPEQGADGVYGISNASNINLTTSLQVNGSSAFLASPITAVIYEINPENGVAISEEYEKEFENLVFLSTGESATVSTTLNFPGFDPSKMYSIAVFYLSGTTRVQFGSIRFGASSGVEEIMADSSALKVVYDRRAVRASSEAGLETVAVYDINGMAVASVEANGRQGVELPVEGLSNGIYIIKATDLAGSTRTLKIRL